MKKIARFLFLTIFPVFSLLPEVRADVVLPEILGSNMVLQRDTEVKIWGRADAGEKVTVQFNGQTKKTTAGKDGKWMVSLAPLPAGGPYDMIIKGKNTIHLNNILMGDVWVCSGQSNMEWPLSQVNNAAEEVDAARYPRIRIIGIPRNIQMLPADDVPDTEWRECTPESAAGFSAVGYFFGRKIHTETGVPIGLIGSNWGGTVVETWISREMSFTDPAMKQQVEEMDKISFEEYKKEMKARMDAILEGYDREGSGKAEGLMLWADGGGSLKGWEHEMELPGLWEDRGLPFIDGIVWFRKDVELTKEQAEGKAGLTLDMIDDSDVTWVNGTKVGETWNQYNLAREYKIPAGLLHEGVNTIIIRVEDTGGGGGIYGDLEGMKLKTAAGDISLAGKWNYRLSVSEVWYESNTIGPNDRPTLLFNGMIRPLLNFAIKGAIWYQGESNAGEAYLYRKRFRMLIEDWRSRWNNPNLAFYFVQLANYMRSYELPTESAWAELREAQTMALSMDHTGMAVTIDIGDAGDIHPRNKQDVGLRLALAALHNEYGKDIVWSGPVLESSRVDGNRIILSFSSTGSGLVARDRYGYLKGFSVAGADRKFHWARAMIRGNEVVVWSDEVAEPVAARYAWADNPDDANLYNREGLPASPFRTDQFKGVTER